MSDELLKDHIRLALQKVEDKMKVSKRMIDASGIKRDPVEELFIKQSTREEIIEVFRDIFKL